MSVAAHYEIADLLEQAGARPRGNRHDCPKCQGYRTERLRVLDELHDLAELKRAAHMLGPESETAWDALASIYRQWPSIIAKAVLLSDGSVIDRRHWLEADGEGRKRMADSILIAVGVTDDGGGFVEVNI